MRKLLAAVLCVSVLFGLNSIVEAKHGQGGKEGHAAVQGSTDQRMPPGLANRGEFPSGLSKRDKEPAGWHKGKKKGWFKSRKEKGQNRSEPE